MVLTQYRDMASKAKSLSGLLRWPRCCRPSEKAALPNEETQSENCARILHTDPIDHSFVCPKLFPDKCTDAFATYNSIGKPKANSREKGSSIQPTPS